MPPTFTNFFHHGPRDDRRWPHPPPWGWNHWGRNGHGPFDHRSLEPRQVTTTIRPSSSPKYAPDLQIVGISVFTGAILIAFVLLIIKIFCVICGCKKSKKVSDIREVSEEPPSQERRRSRPGDEQQIDCTSETPVSYPIPSAPPQSDAANSNNQDENVTESPQPPPFDPPPSYTEAVIQSQYGTNHGLELQGKCP